MDTALQYVRMCKGSAEIQSRWKFEVGDYFSMIPQAILYERCVAAGEDTVTRGCSIVDRWWLDDPSTKKHLENGTFPEPWAWLPRQDQLQEMLSAEHRTTYKDTHAYKEANCPNGFIVMISLGHFSMFVDEEYEYIDYIGLDSMEQLWLAYVMDHVYKKRWDGNKWIPSIGGT